MKVHANAPLGPKGRETMVLRVVVDGWSVVEAAAAAGVSERTCSKWVARYRAGGSAGLLDRSSAPSVVANRTDERRIEAIAALRRVRLTGAEIALGSAVLAGAAFLGASAAIAALVLRESHDATPAFCVGLRDFAVAAALAAQAFGPAAAVVAGVYGVMMLVAGAALAALERRARPWKTNPPAG